MNPSAKQRTFRYSKTANALGLLVAAFFYATVFVGVYGAPPYAPFQLSARVSKLTPGMTEPEVWRTLGYELHLGEGSGPRDDIRMGYSLPLGYGLGLVWDRTMKPARLKRGTWRTPLSKTTFGLPHS